MSLQVESLISEIKFSHFVERTVRVIFSRLYSKWQLSVIGIFNLPGIETIDTELNHPTLLHAASEALT